MTKYSKITKSAFAIIVLSLVLCAVLAFGGTYAYFNAYAKSNAATVTAGTLTLNADIDGTLTINNVEKIVPNQTISLDSVNNAELEGNTVSALRIKIVVSSITAGTVATANSLTPDAEKLTVAITNASGYTWSAKQDDGYYYLNKVVVGGAEGTALSTYGTIAIVLDNTAGNEWQGASCTVTITVEAAQAEYHATGDPMTDEAAYTAGTEITLENAKKLAWPTVA